MDAPALSLYGLTRFRTFLLTAAFTVLLLIGVTMRVGMLARNVRFHPDEALYATFARRVSLHADLLLSDAPLDKPPLAIAITAISFSIVGVSEFAARFPTLLISLLTLATFYALAHRLYRDTALALLALALLAISPFDLTFSATAFLDPLLTFLVLLACLLASRSRWCWSGVAFILAIATKQSALFFLPLVIGLGIAANLPIRRRTLAINLCYFVLPVIIGSAIIALWSAARTAPIDFWTLGTINNNPGRFIRANELLPRLSRWTDLLSNVVGFGPLLFLGVVPLFRQVSRQLQPQQKLIDLVLCTFSLTMLLAYWLIAFNTYDRYLHTLNLLLLLLIARAVQHFPALLRIALVLCVIPFSYRALNGDLAIGGDNGTHTGIDQLAAVANTFPAGTIIRNYLLDWELKYYLGDDTSVQSVFEPSPEMLMRHVCPQGGYFAAFAKEASAWLDPLKIRGVSSTIMVDGQVQLYQLDCTF